MIAICLYNIASLEGIRVIRHRISAILQIMLMAFFQ